MQNQLKATTGPTVQLRQESNSQSENDLAKEEAHWTADTLCIFLTGSTG